MSDRLNRPRPAIILAAAWLNDGYSCVFGWTNSKGGNDLEYRYKVAGTKKYKSMYLKG